MTGCKTEAGKKVMKAVKTLLTTQTMWGYKAMRMDYIETDCVPKMATNGTWIKYSPKFVQESKMYEVVFGVAHEIVHCELLHHTRLGSFQDKELAQEVADLVTNSLLEKAGLQRPSWVLFEEGSENYSVEQLYHKKYQERLQRESEGQQQPSKQQDQFSEDEQESEKSDQGESREDEKDSGGNQEPGSSDSQQDEQDGSGSDGGSDQGEESKDQSEDGSEGSQEGSESGSEGDGDGNGDASNSETGKDQGGQGQGSGKSEQEGQDSDTESQGSQSQSGIDKDWNIGHVEEAVDEETGEPKRDEAQRWKIMSSQALNFAKSQGTVPGWLEEIIREIIDPKIDVKELLRQYLEMNCRNDYTFSRPNPRYLQNRIYLPSLNSEGIKCVYIIVDTSLSVTSQDLTDFSAIMSSILEEYQTKIVVLYVDTRVAHIDTFESSDLPVEFTYYGRGGTYFTPGFVEIDTNPDLDPPTCVIYLTDGRANDFPEDPGYSVAWVITANGVKSFAPPFGEVVHMK